MIREKFCNEPRVQRVPGFVRFHPAKERTPSEREIADQIVRLVTNEFIGGPQRSIHNSVAREDDRIF